MPELHDPPHQPIDHPELTDNRNIFHIIRERKALLLQPPYESFLTSVERFLRTASVDPKVLAIKMTLYRTSSDTKVIDNLVRAARNGKQVARGDLNTPIGRQLIEQFIAGFMGSDLRGSPRSPVDTPAPSR